MKRVLIIIAVTLLHVLALFWFLSRTPDSPDPGDAESGTSEPMTSEETRSGSPEKKATTGQPAKSLKTIDLRNDSRELPPSLNQAAEQATTGILIDWTGQRILWQKQPDTPVPIASMTKMMTALLLIEAVQQDPLIKLSTPVKGTRTAAKIGGRQVYLDPRETFTVDEMLKCMMIFSANDVAYLVAEFVSGGNPDAFIASMNKRAKSLGLQETTFRTPNGLPPATGPEDTSSARDMALLAAHLLQYPEIVKWSSTWLSYIRQDSERFEPFQLVNTNKLIRESPGVKGMKTGYTNAAGFCIAATCERDQRVLIAVVTGFPSAAARNDFVKKLLDWGYSR